MKEQINALCFDVETGGFSAERNMLLSATFKKVGTDKILNIFLKPNHDLFCTPGALKVNGLSLSKLENEGLSEKDAIDKINKFIKDTCDEDTMMMGHNVMFDVKFLNALYERNNEKPFANKFNSVVIDTLSEMKQLQSENKVDVENCKLNTCYKYFFGSDIENAHTAECDVIATEKVYFEIAKLFDN